MKCGFRLHDTMIYRKRSGGANGNVKTAYLACWEYMFIFSKDAPKTANLIRDRKNVKKPSIKNEHPGWRKSTGEVKSKRIVKRKEFGLRWNIWDYDIGYNLTTKDKIAFQHPAIFPELLIHDHIVSWSNKEDVVLDPFMGSGTTGKMSKLLNRSFIGIELNLIYFEIAQDRIANVIPPGNTKLS